MIILGSDWGRNLVGMPAMCPYTSIPSALPCKSAAPPRPITTILTHYAFFPFSPASSAVVSLNCIQHPASSIQAPTAPLIQSQAKCGRRPARAASRLVRNGFRQQARCRNFSRTKSTERQFTQPQITLLPSGTSQPASFGNSL